MKEELIRIQCQTTHPPKFASASGVTTTKPISFKEEKVDDKEWSERTNGSLVKCCMLIYVN